MSPIDPGHLDAMQYDFGEVAGNLAASSLPQNVDLTTFSKSKNENNASIVSHCSESCAENLKLDS